MGWREKHNLTLLIIEKDYKTIIDILEKELDIIEAERDQLREENKRLVELLASYTDGCNGLSKEEIKAEYYKSKGAG